MTFFRAQTFLFLLVLIGIGWITTQDSFAEPRPETPRNKSKSLTFPTEEIKIHFRTPLGHAWEKKVLDLAPELEGLRIGFDAELHPEIFARILAYFDFDAAWEKQDIHSREDAWHAVMARDLWLSIDPAAQAERENLPFQYYKDIFNDPPIEAWDASPAEGEPVFTYPEKREQFWKSLDAHQRAARKSVQQLPQITRAELATYLEIGRPEEGEEDYTTVLQPTSDMPEYMRRFFLWHSDEARFEMKLRKGVLGSIYPVLLIGKFLEEIGLLESLPPAAPYDKHALGASYHIHISFPKIKSRFSGADIEERMTLINFLWLLKILRVRPGDVSLFDNKLSKYTQFNPDPKTKGIICWHAQDFDHIQIREHWSDLFTEILYLKRFIETENIKTMRSQIYAEARQIFREDPSVWERLKMNAYAPPWDISNGDFFRTLKFFESAYRKAWPKKCANAVSRLIPQPRTKTSSGLPLLRRIF